MSRRRIPEDWEENTEEELELLIEEKYKEIEMLEAKARSRYAKYDDLEYEAVRQRRRTRPDNYEERRSEAPRRRPRPENYEERRKETPRRRPRTEYREEPEVKRTKERKAKATSKTVEKPKKEKSRFSEKLIRKIGGLIGVIIALLVVAVVFGGDIISGLIGTTKLASSEGVINILLVGQDGREDVEGSRSDSMMLVSVNKDTDQVKIISLMRDMYVSIPGHDDNRINAAYSMGGIDLLTKTVEQNFQVKIDGNVQIDFESFKTIVDSLGGVDITLSQAEADYLNQAYWQHGWTLTEGVQTLNGDQALAYSRVRQVGNSDFQRTERQRTVLMTAFQKVKGQGKVKMMSLAKEIYPMLDTDIGLKDMLNLGVTALNLADGSIETYRLPIDGGFENQTIRNMAVLVPNLELHQNYLKELLYGTATE